MIKFSPGTTATKMTEKKQARKAAPTKPTSKITSRLTVETSAKPVARMVKNTTKARPQKAARVPTRVNTLQTQPSGAVKKTKPLYDVLESRATATFNTSLPKTNNGLFEKLPPLKLKTRTSAAERRKIGPIPGLSNS